MSSLVKLWPKPQLFVCRNSRGLTVLSLSSTISHFASAMEKNPEVFIGDTTGGEFFNRHQIVHLYQEDKGWKPTKGTESNNPGQELWWGVLVQSHKQPYIDNLKRYRFGENWKVVVEDLECTRDDLKGYYSDEEVEAALERRSY